MGTFMDAQNETAVFVQPHFDRGIYANFAHEPHKGFVWRSLYMFCASWLQKIRKPPEIPSCVGVSEPLDVQPPLSITWIGHSTFLIRIFDITILTDPIFGHASWLFPRIQPPGMALAHLPRIDYILISHNHRDHMDAKTLHALVGHNSVILVPQGDKQWFDRRGFGRAYEATWWQPFLFSGHERDIEFTFLPALHWSQRSLTDRNRSLWGSWMISYQGYTIYFGGDSAYWSHFGQIRKKFSQIDVALLPIGPCEPRQWLAAHHMSSQEAGQAFLDLQAHNFIPMHWGTFYFGIDEPFLPLQRLHDWWSVNMHVLSNKTLHVPAVGQMVSLQHFVAARPPSMVIQDL